MRTRPTPGPWHYETTPQGNVTIFATRNGDDDKIIIGMSQFGPLEQREANARHICAAINQTSASHSGYCTYLSDQDAYYLRSILARLRGCLAEINEGPSLYGEVLADNIDWLDCFIERHSPEQVAA